MTISNPDLARVHTLLKVGLIWSIVSFVTSAVLQICLFIVARRRP